MVQVVHVSACSMGGTLADMIFLGKKLNMWLFLVLTFEPEVTEAIIFGTISPLMNVMAWEAYLQLRALKYGSIEPKRTGHISAS